MVLNYRNWNNIFKLKVAGEMTNGRQTQKGVIDFPGVFLNRYYTALQQGSDMSR